MINGNEMTLDEALILCDISLIGYRWMLHEGKPRIPALDALDVLVDKARSDEAIKMIMQGEDNGK